MVLFLGDSFGEESVTRGGETRNQTTWKDANQPGPAQGFLFVPYLMARCGRQKTIEVNHHFNIFASVWPRRAGDGDTVMPAASMAAILESAPPLPPAIIAPACPVRRPGGAVRPAMNPTIGFLRPRLASSLMNCAASSSDEPPISPIITIASVALSARNISSISMKSVPLTGSPPMPTAVVWPKPSWVVWNTAS